MGIVSMSFTPIWRPANPEPRSQQMALRSYFSSRNCLGKSFPAQKSIVRELELTQAQNGACACHCFQVTCNLVTHSPLDWLLFVSAKNKPRLVLPLTAAGREGARLDVPPGSGDGFAPSALALTWVTKLFPAGGAPREMNALQLLDLHSLPFTKCFPSATGYLVTLSRSSCHLYSLFFYL